MRERLGPSVTNVILATHLESMRDAMQFWVDMQYRNVRNSMGGTGAKVVLIFAKHFDADYRLNDPPRVPTWYIGK